MPPLVAALMKFGMGVLGNAVLAQGKELVEDKLGVNLEGMLGTEQGRIELKRLEMQHEQFLIDAGVRRREQELEADRLANANTASAREMNARIQESASASALAKEAAYYLDFLVVGSTILLAGLLLFKAIPLDNKELVYMVLGALLAHCGTILNFHRGTSASSRGKDVTIEKLSTEATR